MLNAHSLAVMTDRITRTLAILESAAETFLLLSAVHHGCPPEEAGPALDHMIARGLLLRHGGQITLSHIGWKLVDEVVSWRVSHGATVAESRTLVGIPAVQP